MNLWEMKQTAEAKVAAAYADLRDARIDLGEVEDTSYWAGLLKLEVERRERIAIRALCVLEDIKSKMRASGRVTY